MTHAAHNHTMWGEAMPLTSTATHVVEGRGCIPTSRYMHVELHPAHHDHEGASEGEEAKVSKLEALSQTYVCNSRLLHFGGRRCSVNDGLTLSTVD